MKKIILFVFVLGASHLFSQNWAPINTSEKFCYSSDDTLDIINNVLWVDSTEQMSDHEIYYFNKIVAPCDTCSEPYFMLMNQPQFLLDYAKVYDNAEWEFMNENHPNPVYHSFKLYPYESLGFQWDFNDEMTAEITFEYDSYPIFEGVSDQVKVICLSDETCILLSKNHGIISWGENYLLVGIEGRDLGTIVPKFDDMFAEINIGDVLCYYTYSAEAYKNVEFKHNYLRYEVTHIEKNEDSVVLEASYHRKFTEFEYGKNDVITYGDTVLYFYPNVLTEAYPNQPVFQYEWFDAIIITEIAKEKWGGLMKTNSRILTENGFQLTTYEPDAIVPELLIPLPDLNESKYDFSIDYGLMERVINGFEWSYSNQIIGYLHNGDTLGEIYPIDMFVGQAEMTSNRDFLVFPNPSKDILKIHSLENGEYMYKIYNLAGVLYQSGVFAQENNEKVFSVRDLPKGMYFIEITSKERKYSEKWLKIE